MSYNIFPTYRFEKELKRLAKKFPSLKNEFAELIRELLVNPESGTFIGNNCYKIRLAIGSKGKGKSGGARVITYLYIETETIYTVHTINIVQSSFFLIVLFSCYDGINQTKLIKQFGLFYK